MALPRRTSALFASAFVIIAGSALFRERVVAAVPQTGVLFSAVGMPVNLDRLELGPVKATVRFENDLRTLLVESEIANTRATPMSAPMLRVSIREGSGATVYSWTVPPGAKTIPAGGRVPVRARLTAPPTGQDVIVEFVRS